jgi:hypothetical protein
MITQSQKRSAIDIICEANNGTVTADLVVAAAKNASHVLHSLFDWNDKTAAHQQRLDIARNIIASVQIIVEYEDRKVSAISYIRDPRTTRGYVPVSDLAKRRDDAQAALLIELDRIMACVERSRSIASGLGLESYFEAILANAMTAKTKIRTKKKAA